MNARLIARCTGPRPFDGACGFLRRFGWCGHFVMARRSTSGEPVEILSGAFARSSASSMNTDEAHRRAEALFKKEQQSHEAQQAMTEYEAELQAMREKTARLRALRLARDAVNQKMQTAR
jgi:hypothetical protein